jgi:hypothetical protein
MARTRRPLTVQPGTRRPREPDADITRPEPARPHPPRRSGSLRGGRGRSGSWCPAASAAPRSSKRVGSRTGHWRMRAQPGPHHTRWKQPVGAKTRVMCCELRRSGQKETARPTARFPRSSQLPPPGNRSLTAGRTSSSRSPPAAFAASTPRPRHHPRTDADHADRTETQRTRTTVITGRITSNAPLVPKSEFIIPNGQWRLPQSSRRGVQGSSSAA